MELVKHIYKDSEMASYTIEVLLKDLQDKDNKIICNIKEIHSKYLEFLKVSKTILKKEKQDLPKTKLMSKMGAKMGIDKEVSNDNSDSSIADMLIKGIGMGSIDTKKKIDTFKNSTDKKHLKLAEEFLKFQETYIEDLKKYL